MRAAYRLRVFEDHAKRMGNVRAAYRLLNPGWITLWWRASFCCEATAKGSAQRPRKGGHEGTRSKRSVAKDQRPRRWGARAPQPEDV